MRNDEQLLNDQIEETRGALAEVATNLYEAIGPSAVCQWGHKVGLRFALCVPCETDTPTIGDPMGETCAVCGTLREKK